MAVHAEKGWAFAGAIFFAPGKGRSCPGGERSGGGDILASSHHRKIYIKKNIPARSVKFCENFALDLRGIIII